ncbi:Chk1 protein kinase [Tulasnella sp. 427]|nr:Chk1 protein kinase [Tulasnella sp. 427]
MERGFPVINGFHIRNKIGDGGFSKVYRAINYTSTELAACKVVPILQQTWTPNAKKELFKEIKVHSQLKHSHVLEFLGSETYEDNEETTAKAIIPAVYMLLEMAGGGDLFDKIVPDVGVPERVAHLYFTQLMAGIEFIHSKGVCHRDLKPENVMLGINGFLKVCDFGLCAVYKHKGMERLLTERCGSLPYVAPELNGKEPYQAEPVDIWGCGVILFTMLVGNTPWDEPTDASPEFVAYVRGKIFSTPPWDRLRGKVVDFLLKVLDPNPKTRIAGPAMAQDPWFSQYVSSAQASETELTLVCGSRENPLLRADEGAWADALSNPLKTQGFMDVADPGNPQQPGDMDTDGDARMYTNNNASQFTQNLLLFSQTQGGTRYTPELTRFYTGNGCHPQGFLSLAVPVLQQVGFKCRQPEVTYRTTSANAMEEDDVTMTGAPPRQDIKKCSMKIAGEDARKLPLKGFVDIEPFKGGSFVVMRRETGDPVAWKRLWRTLITNPDVSPYVLRKHSS